MIRNVFSFDLLAPCVEFLSRDNSYLPASSNCANAQVWCLNMVCRTFSFYLSALYPGDSNCANAQMLTPALLS